MTPPRPVVLLIDDNDAFRDNVAEVLEREGILCWPERSADEALRALQIGCRAPDAIVVDLRMPGMQVPRFISYVKERATWATAPIILITAATDQEVPPALGVDAILHKPVATPRLLEALRRALTGPRSAAIDRSSERL